MERNGCIWRPFVAKYGDPDGNHGDNRIPPLNPPAAPALPSRDRLSLDVSPSVSLLLDHISGITSTPKAQLISQALLDALPSLLERADLLKRRAAELSQSQKQRK